MLRSIFVTSYSSLFPFLALPAIVLASCFAVVFFLRQVGSPLSSHVALISLLRSQRSRESFELRLELDVSLRFCLHHEDVKQGINFDFELIETCSDR